MFFTFKTSLNLMLSVAVITFGTTALSSGSHAADPSTPQTVSQNSSRAGSTNKPKIVLTDKQKEQIQTIRKNANSQIIAVLTPEQKAIIQKAASSGKASGSLEAELKLTKEQESKIKSIQTQSKQQIQAILTPEQIEILKKQATP